MIEVQPSVTDCATTTPVSVDRSQSLIAVADPSDIQLDINLLDVAIGGPVQPSEAIEGWLSAAEFAQSFVRQEVQVVLQQQLPPLPLSAPSRPTEASSEISTAVGQVSAVAMELPALAEELQPAPVEETQPEMRGNSSSSTDDPVASASTPATTTISSISGVSGDVQELAEKLSQISIASTAPLAVEEKPSTTALPPITPSNNHIGQLLLQLSGKPSRLQPLPQDLLEQNAYLLVIHPSVW